MIEDIIKNARLSRSGRKLFSSDQKVLLVDYWESSGLSCPEFCRRYGLISSQLYKWRSDSKRGSIMGIKNEGMLHSKSEIDQLLRENDELKRALGELTLDNKILKKKLEQDLQKKQKSKRYPSNSQ